jgi:hypothetical protein
MNKTPQKRVTVRYAEGFLAAGGSDRKRLCEIFHDFGIINTSNKIALGILI